MSCTQQSHCTWATRGSSSQVQDGEHVTNNTTTVTVEDVDDDVRDVPPQIAVNVTFDSWSQDHWVTFIQQPFWYFILQVQTKIFWS